MSEALISAGGAVIVGLFSLVGVMITNSRANSKMPFLHLAPEMRCGKGIFCAAARALGELSLLLSGGGRGHGLLGPGLRELFGQEAQQRAVDHEEEADLHGIAYDVLDEAAQEDGRSGLVIEDGQP